MDKIIYSVPGSSIVLYFEVLNSFGMRINASQLPIVSRVLNNSLQELSGFPQNFSSIDVGLYAITITLPTGTSGLGSFIVDISWINPDNGLENQTFYQINSRISFGVGGYSAGVV